MGICAINNGGIIEEDLSSTFPDCAEYLIPTSTEFQALQPLNTTSLESTLEVLFAFDPAIAAQVNGVCFLAFVIGHGTGRLVRTLGKS